MIAMGSEPEKMTVQLGSSGSNAGDASPGKSPKKITLQVQCKLKNSKIRFHCQIPINSLYFV